MKKEQWNESVNHIEADLIEEFVEKSTKLEAKNRTKRLWMRMGAIAACFCLLVTGLVVFGKNTLFVPVWRKARFSAQEIADIANDYTLSAVATNAYKKVYAPNQEFLYIQNVPDDAFLKIYQYKKPVLAIQEQEFQEFIDSFMGNLSSALGGKRPLYEIKTLLFAEDELCVDVDVGGNRIWAYHSASTNSVSLQPKSDDRKILLDGEPVQIDQRLSDEEIIASLDGIKNKLFKIFGTSFQDVKIYRCYNFYKNGADYIDIYFYNADAHPLNAQSEGPYSDRISIRFENDDNYDGDIVSDSILSATTIRYTKVRSQGYQVLANARKISLKEAEKLLYKGYVFGGHACRLCMEAQEKVSFEDYDFVGLEYVFGRDHRDWITPTIGIPFYAFYKEIGTAQNGNLIYARTYVPAIQVYGYEEYFESQVKDHRNGYVKPTELVP